MGREVVGFFMLKINNQQTCKGLITGVIQKERGKNYTLNHSISH